MAGETPKKEEEEALAFLSRFFLQVVTSDQTNHGNPHNGPLKQRSHHSNKYINSEDYSPSLAGNDRKLSLQHQNTDEAKEPGQTQINTIMNTKTQQEKAKAKEPKRIRERGSMMRSRQVSLSATIE